MTTNPIKVLFVAHSPVLGGADRCLMSLLASLDRDVVTPVVAVPGSGPVSKACGALGIATREVELRWWVGVGRSSLPRRLLFARDLDQRVGALERIIEGEQIDLVFSNTSVIVEGALAASRTGRPHVWHVLEMLRQDAELRPFLPLDYMYTMLDALSSRVVVVSEGVASDLKSIIDPRKIRVIHTGIRSMEEGCCRKTKSEMFGVSEMTPVVSFAGMLSRRKGILVLLDAAKLVLEKVPNARFMVAGGDAGLRQKISSSLRTLGIGQAVRLLGYRSDVPQIIASSDVFVLPSLADPLPVAVLEAMHLGRPVVATRSGGCTEMVQDGKTGYLVAPGDPVELADAVVKVLSNADRAEEMGRAARSLARREFDDVGCAQKFADLFEEVLHGNTEGTDPRLSRLMRAGTALLSESGGASIFDFAQSRALRGVEIARSSPVGTLYRHAKTWCYAVQDRLRMH